MRISTIIPCYNHQQQVEAAIASVLQQSWDDYEIIVVDDGSNPPLIHHWPDKVKLITHEYNRGLSHALNTGIAASTGDYFSILAADDGYVPSFVKELATQAQHYPSVDIFSCDMLTPRGVVYCKPGSLPDLKLHNCHSYAALTKRWVWEKTGGYNTHMNPSWEDWEFWLHAAKLGAKWLHVNKPLHMYRRSPDGRDAIAQGKDTLLMGKMQGFHQDLFGQGAGEVAFVVPCYNHEEFVRIAVDSAFAQTYPHVRVIVVDDGSPGDVVAALRKYPNSNLTLLRQQNKHLSGARNSGIELAINQFNSQYIVPLDADDEVLPTYIEHLMPYNDGMTYTYCDIQFMGDAWHTFQVENYDCAKLTRKHLHACTILMNAFMYQKIVSRRGYGYDETMQEGYEDWEFALSLLRSGFCGRRIPTYDFKYRHHKDGSMRTEAALVNDKLVEQINRRHIWVKDKEQVLMACGSCGKSKYAAIITKNAGGTIMSFNVPGVGLVDGREPISVVYSGSQTSKIQKVGTGGTIYNYSGNPNGTYGPVFTIFARDVHLFQGAYTFSRVNPLPVEIAQVPAPVKVAAHPPAPKPTQVASPVEAQLMTSPEQRLAAKAEKEIITYEPDDFTQIKFVGESGAAKLRGHGFFYYEDIADAEIAEVASVLSMSKDKTKKVLASVQEILDKLEALD